MNNEYGRDPIGTSVWEESKQASVLFVVAGFISVPSPESLREVGFIQISEMKHSIPVAEMADSKYLIGMLESSKLEAFAGSNSLSSLGLYPKELIQ